MIGLFGTINPDDLLDRDYYKEPVDDYMDEDEVYDRWLDEQLF